MAVDNEKAITVLHGKLSMAVKKELASRADKVTDSGFAEVEECDILFHTVSDVIDLDEFIFSPDGSNTEDAQCTDTELIKYRTVSLLLDLPDSELLYGGKVDTNRLDAGSSVA
eukprot:4936110-Pleurochrysis_carterae.AAC.1